MNQLYPRLYFLSKVPKPVWFIALSKRGCIIIANGKDCCFFVTYMPYQSKGRVCLIRTIILLATNDLQQYDTKTKDI